MPTIRNKVKILIDIFDNPFVRIAGVSAGNLVAWVGGVVLLACLCFSVHWYVKINSAYAADVSRLTVLTGTLKSGKPGKFQQSQGFLDDLPRSVVPEVLIGEVHEFSQKNNMSLEDVTIQNDLTVAGKLGQIHYVMTLRGDYIDIKKLLINSLTKHVGLVVDKVVIKKSQVGRQSQNISFRAGAGEPGSGIAKNGAFSQDSEAIQGIEEADVVLTQWFKP
jgi:hypothetical protein